MHTAHIQGRFQPFHREHAEYARWAAEHGDKLIVGITRPDPSRVTTESDEPKRHKPKHNPFTYYERHRMLTRFFEQSDVDVPVSIVPFPITRPDLWDHYSPQSVVHYVNVLEEWHRVKVRRFKANDREVVWKEDDRTVSGEGIRKRMAAEDEWESDLPEPIVAEIERIDGVDRVQSLIH